MPIPIRSKQDWQSLDAAHHLHPFTDYADLAAKGARIISWAEGAYLHDVDGRTILDGMSGLWCVNLGYGRRDLAEAAQRQMLELAYYNNFFQTAHPPAIELAHRLAEFAAPEFTRAFFTGSGSESVDTAIRMIWRYWQLQDQPQRNVIIGRRNGYHGSSIAGASLGGMKAVHEQLAHPVPGFVHIDQPYAFGEGAGVDPAAFGLERARQLAQKIEEVGPDKVAAFFAEPIQGAGGVILPPDTYWPEIERICRHYGILLVTDEVICGFGRTGKRFGAEYYGVTPDLMTVAKGLTSGYVPMGAVLLGERVGEVLAGGGGEFFHGYTYSGHPVAAAVALQVLRTLEAEKVIERVRDDTGPYLQQRWRTLAEHPLVGEARGLGFFGAIELVRNKQSRERFPQALSAGLRCREFCFDNGLVMRAVGDTMIVAPPLILDRDGIDELVEKAWKCLDLTAAAIAN